MASREEPLTKSQRLTSFVLPFQLLLHPAAVCTFAVTAAIAVASLAAGVLFNPASVIVKPPQRQNSVARVPEQSNVDSSMPASLESGGRLSDSTSPDSALPMTSNLISSRHSESMAVPAETASSVLWTWGLVGISCAVGCFLISRGLTRRAIALETASRSAWNPRTHSGRRISTLPKRGRRANPNYQGPDSSEGATVALNLDQVEDPNWVVTDPQPESLQVTVLPPEAVHPLDWGEHSLAYQLDIRKEQPISFWT